MKIDDKIIENMVNHAKRILVLDPKKSKTTANKFKLIHERLMSFHNEYVTEKVHNDQGWSGICLSLGIYIGELIKDSTNIDFAWIYDKTPFSEDSIPFLRSEKLDLYVTDWVYKNIVYGNKESMVDKYRELLKYL